MFQRGVAKTYKDILQFYYNGEYIYRPYSFLKSRSPKYFFQRVGRVFKYFMAICKYPFRSADHQSIDIKGRIWLYANTDNQKQSLLPIDRSHLNSVFVKSNYSEVNFDGDDWYRLKYNLKFIYFWRYFHVLVTQALFDLKTTYRFFDLIFVSIGEYECAYRYLKKYRPTCIVFSNDHNIDCRCVLNAAIDLNIPTVYIQHASVTTYFPPLSFDLNLLEGEVSKEKYLQAGVIKGEVKFIGISKFANAHYHRREKVEKVKNIGIATNLFDEINDIKEIILLLKKEFSKINFSYRPHPSDEREIKSFLMDSNVQLSTRDNEGALDFLTKQDLLIASNSNIHLEANCLGLKTIYFEFTPDEKNFDAYGFMDEEIFELAQSNKDLVNLISKSLEGYQIDIKKPKRFNDILGTKYENDNGSLIIKYLEEFISDSA